MNFLWQTVATLSHPTEPARADAMPVVVILAIFIFIWLYQQITKEEKKYAPQKKPSNKDINRMFEQMRQEEKSKTNIYAQDKDGQHRQFFCAGGWVVIR